jgi:cytidine deaminase
MSQNPFTADPAIRQRIAELEASIGPAIRNEIEVFLARQKHAVADNSGGVLMADEVARLIDKHGLESDFELMLLARPSAEKLARPPISQFFVGIVGRERGTGNLIFGCNVEFPGSHLGYAIHGEGCVFTRAFSRGTAIDTLALGEAHPCAHCRQFLSEFAATRDLLLIDPLGHRLTMSDLYPWPFDPAYLGETGLVPGTVYSPALGLGANSLVASVAELLTDTGRRAYAPYSKCPGAVVLQLRDGNLVAGSSIESVAFNPTIGPMQGALFDLLMHGYTYADIAKATLGTVIGGAVDYTNSTAELLAAVAPEATLDLVDWTGVTR